MQNYAVSGAVQSGGGHVFGSVREPAYVGPRGRPSGRARVGKNLNGAGDDTGMEPALLIAIVVVGLFAGTMGGMFGIGGGVILFPVMTVVFGLTPVEAAASNLVGIVATSAGSGVGRIRKGTANIRLGIILEITTVAGAVTGAFLAMAIDGRYVIAVFAAVMLYTGIRMAAPSRTYEGASDGPYSYYDEAEGREIRYSVENRRTGLPLCAFAGAVSSFTGVGGGAIKVPVMNMCMHIPLKVATATSSYMIGLTAFSGALIYLISGQVLLDVAAVTAIGTYFGGIAGSKIADRTRSASLKKYMAVLYFAIFALMLLKLGGFL